ncbi:hypothetical protein [Streptomyces sp. MNP-20]|uniref:hypothetical protein n=1 Tax=Streptomyces sp. MNP-20 TaxID=2721165 RepID=UPI0020A67D7A|nr:hypothetical protein [Streptomyces sp. MNP-20]
MKTSESVTAATNRAPASTPTTPATAVDTTTPCWWSHQRAGKSPSTDRPHRNAAPSASAMTAPPSARAGAAPRASAIDESFPSSPAMWCSHWCTRAGSYSAWRPQGDSVARTRCRACRAAVFAARVAAGM